MKNLTKDRWIQIDNLFQEVLDQSPETRHQYLHDVCGSDTELREHIEKLLQIHNESEKILGDSIDAFAAPLVPGLLDEAGEIDQDGNEIGSLVGSYEILKKIGRGGMGAVYLARKTDAPYEKKVALKLVRSGLDSADILRRFRNEGQILASLEHKSIARLYDGGVHEDGRPYFVMEYVEGEPIDRYCDTRRLTINERLNIFKDVCEAVHFAHQNLVVHRDIKPANVLITEDGLVKLVDFGIAKLLDSGGMDEPSKTQTGIKLLTPEYASPEQIQGKTITTSADVYSLGVLLYLLITGRKPYRFDTNSMLEIERVISEAEPVRPCDAVVGKSLYSPKITEPTFDPETSAQLRAKDLTNLVKELRSDLEKIVLKALRKEPERRYRSVLEFAEDLENYLTGRPVQARPATFRYRAQKFVIRNYVGVLAAAVAILSVLGGLGIALWQADVAKAERDIAQNEAAKAKAAQEYLVNLFEAADPAQSEGREITAHEIVEKGIEQLEENLSNQPDVHAEMLKVLGRVELALGDFDQSTELLDEALQKKRELYGDDHIEIAKTASILGEVLRWDGEFERSETLLREALDIHRRLIRDDHVEVAVNIDRLARTLEMRDKLDESEELYREALAMRERLSGENSDAVSANLNNLGWLLYQKGKLEEAEEYLRRSLQIKNRIMDSPHPAISSNLSNLSVVLRAKGSYLEAEEFAEQAVEQEINLYGDDHPRVTTALNNQTLILLDLGRYSEAAENYRMILENNRRQLGENHLYVGFSLSGLGRALTEDGRSEEALPLYDEALEIYQNSVGDQHRYYGMSLALKGEALYYQDLQESEQVLEESVEIIKLAVGNDHPNLAKAMTSLGRTQFANGNIEAAESTISEALEIQRRVLPGTNANTVWTLINLGQVLSAQNRYDEAEAVLYEAVEMASSVLPQSHWQSLTARLELASCLAKNGHESDTNIEIKKIFTELQGRTDFHAIGLKSRAEELVM
ncbi:MAG: serine/threonine-protein kinase [Balneolaceae bacterium]|nr:serine/threonine-protein kinase [Balneolaceae bacterium]